MQNFNVGLHVLHQEAYCEVQTFQKSQQGPTVVNLILFLTVIKVLVGLSLLATAFQNFTFSQWKHCILAVDLHHMVYTNMYYINILAQRLI